MGLAMRRFRRTAMQCLRRACCVSLFCGLAVCHLSAAEAPTPAPGDQPWYVTTAAVHRMMLKPTTKYWRFEHLAIEHDAALEQLSELLAKGVTASEVFAPEGGGNSYDGLDAKNRFRLDPNVGTMDGFRQLVKLAHSLGIHMITFQNLGYSSTVADEFLKAEDDERAGKNSRETKFFFWSEQADA